MMAIVIFGFGSLIATAQPLWDRRVVGINEQM